MWEKKDKNRKKKDENREKKKDENRFTFYVIIYCVKKRVAKKPRLILVRDRLDGVVVGASCLNQKRHHLGATNGY